MSSTPEPFQKQVDILALGINGIREHSPVKFLSLSPLIPSSCVSHTVHFLMRIPLHCPQSRKQSHNSSKVFIFFIGHTLRHLTLQIPSANIFQKSHSNQIWTGGLTMDQSNVAKRQVTVFDSV